MKKKSLITMLTALCLTAIVMVGATFAYLSDKTDEVVNTFTVGNVTIDLVEPEWNPENGKDLEVGADVAKDPKIVNTGKNDALVDKEGVKLTSGNSKLVDGYYAYNSIVAAVKDTKPLFTKVQF